MPPLVPCSQCRRHIRIDHDACPFCAATVPRDFAKGVVPAAKARLDRLAVFTFATAIASACSSGGLTSSDDGGTGDSAVRSDGGSGDGSVKDDGGVQAIYGAPVDASQFDSGNVQPPYGLPPEDGGNPVPLYGLPADAGAD